MAETVTVNDVLDGHVGLDWKCSSSGLQRCAIGTLVERTSRFTMLIHLPREDGYGVDPAHQERAGAGRLRRGHDEERVWRRR